MIEASYFGDAQEEAWEILFRKQHGLVSRIENMQGAPYARQPAYLLRDSSPYL
jgi:hypothetical protein